MYDTITHSLRGVSVTNNFNFENSNRVVKIIGCKKDKTTCRNRVETEVWIQAKTSQFAAKPRYDWEFPQIRIPKVSTSIIECEHPTCVYALKGEYYNAFVMERVRDGEELFWVLCRKKITDKRKDFLTNEFPEQVTICIAFT